MPDALVGTAYSQALALEKGSPPFTWSLRDVPAALQWLTIDPATGALGGSPTAAVQPGVALTVSVSDVIHRTDSKTMTLAVWGPPTVTTAALPEAVVGNAYSTVVRADGGKAPFTWSLRDVPAALQWLTIDSATGALGGSPTAAVQPGAAFTAVVVDGNLLEGSAALTVAARDCREGEQLACSYASGDQCLVGVRVCTSGQLTACTVSGGSTSVDECGAGTAGACGVCASATADRCTDGRCACGSGTQCPAVPPLHTLAVTCQGGNCVSQCAAGWGDCDGNVSNGCEADLTTAQHCGSCTNSCSAGDFCCAVPNKVPFCSLPVGETTCS